MRRFWGAIAVLLTAQVSGATLDSSCTKKTWGPGYYLETFAGDTLSFLDLENCQRAESRVNEVLNAGKRSVTVWGCERHIIPTLTGTDPFVESHWGRGIRIQGYYMNQKNQVSRSSSRVEAASWKEAAEKCIAMVKDKYLLY